MKRVFWQATMAKRNLMPKKQKINLKNWEKIEKKIEQILDNHNWKIKQLGIKCSCKEEIMGIISNLLESQKEKIIKKIEEMPVYWQVNNLKNMDIKTLQKKQKELDEELINCPKCGEETVWGEIKETGECLKCYYKYYAKKKKKIKEEIKEIIRNWIGMPEHFTDKKYIKAIDYFYSEPIAKNIIILFRSTFLTLIKEVIKKELKGSAWEDRIIDERWDIIYSQIKEKTNQWLKENL